MLRITSRVLQSGTLCQLVHPFLPCPCCSNHSFRRGTSSQLLRRNTPLARQRVSLLAGASIETSGTLPIYPVSVFLAASAIPAADSDHSAYTRALPQRPQLWDVLTPDETDEARTGRRKPRRGRTSGTFSTRACYSRLDTLFLQSSFQKMALPRFSKTSG